MIILLIVFSLFLLLFFINFFKKRSFVRLFEKGNVVVSGKKGRGKDVAFCVVINTRKKNYISNVQYSKPSKKYQRFDFDSKVWELSGNTYRDLVDNTVKSYSYPYPDGIDYYISDAGIYFPSQYQSELVKRYASAPMFQALSRHLGDCAIHCNTQNQARLWDKIREQSDTFLYMRGCHRIPLTKIFLIRSTVYELEESAVTHIKKPRFGLGKSARAQKLAFQSAHGEIRNISFFARLPYKFDSRRFKRILENNLKDYENE